MTVESAVKQVVHKPWGVANAQPWARTEETLEPIGEIWFERSQPASTGPALLLKLLFTSQPLSIQVHPDDAYAKSVGLSNGKTEAWYVLDAKSGAQVALGLKRKTNSEHMHEAVVSGEIANLVDWQPVSAGDAVYVPAGTIHAIGAGLTIAEIQQRSDTTYRLFDYGRKRELHVKDGLAVAQARPAEARVEPTRLNGQRTVLVRSPYFMLERLELDPNTTWHLNGEQETWLLVLKGALSIGQLNLALGDGAFIQQDRPLVRANAEPAVALVAYARAKPITDLLQPSGTSFSAEVPGSLQSGLPSSQPLSGSVQ